MGGLKPSNTSSLNEWLQWQESLHSQVIDLDLSRVNKVYSILFPNGVPFKVITVAGTNGKGSTIAFINNIYQQSDNTVGTFTSPHITKYNERFAINGENVNDNTICHAFNKIEHIRGNISLTYFEFSTLAALIIFSINKVDIAVIEVGLGGRLDSVNIVDPDVSVITNIDIDHVDYLGNTRELIGLEKAGIMRPNAPCICGDSDPPKSISEHARVIGTKVTFVSSPYTGEINLVGDYQRFNAAVAIKAVESLQTVIPVNEQQIAKGIITTSLNGRFQVIKTEGKEIILDVAHNVAAIKVLAKELEKDITDTLAIFSALKDKNIKSMIEAIRPSIGQWFLVPLNTERAISLTDLESIFDPTDRVKIHSDMDSAIGQAISSSRYHRIVIFGSFYTITDAFKVLNI